MKMFVVQISDPYASHGLTQILVSSMGVRVGRYLFYGGGITRRSLSFSLSLLDENISTKNHQVPSKRVEQHSKELWISMVTTVDGSHDNHGNIVENRDVGYKRNATDALRINFSCNP